VTFVCKIGYNVLIIILNVTKFASYLHLNCLPQVQFLKYINILSVLLPVDSAHKYLSVSSTCGRLLPHF
jgi:hypothetical protein